MFARQLAALEVEHIAVAVVRGHAEDAHAAVILQPPQLSIVGDVTPDRIAPLGVPAGPSDHSAPVHNRWIGALAWRRALKAGSIVSTSGSVKYTFVGVLGPKSRGGLVIVLGGDAGQPRSLGGASRGATARPPTVVAMAVMGVAAIWVPISRLLVRARVVSSWASLPGATL